MSGTSIGDDAISVTVLAQFKHFEFFSLLASGKKKEREEEKTTTTTEGFLFMYLSYSDSQAKEAYLRRRHGRQTNSLYFIFKRVGPPA